MKRSVLVLGPAAILTFCLVFASAQPKPAAKAPLKIFISVDMEGISGIVHGDQTTPGTAEYADGRKWMAQDVNAAVEAALAAGATGVVVNDSHGSMRNIDPDDLHPKAILISGTPKPLSMMQGIDPTFAACLFIGYHAKAGTENAILDHTISGSVVRSIRVNGIEMPELGLNAAIAGYYGVPVVLVSGDTAVCRQAGEVLGKDIVTVAVKEAFGRLAAKLVPMAEARQMIAAGVKDGARPAAPGSSPSSWPRPTGFEIGYHVSAQADMGAMLLPDVRESGCPDARVHGGGLHRGLPDLEGADLAGSGEVKRARPPLPDLLDDPACRFVLQDPLGPAVGQAFGLDHLESAARGSAFAGLARPISMFPRYFASWDFPEAFGRGLPSPFPIRSSPVSRLRVPAIPPILSAPSVPDFIDW
ncbi:MAG: M55 family metallopeptidase [Anaerotruncus sp.]|nr:M55 family metallopeptidase [Anaerotruncus sp.]